MKQPRLVLRFLVLVPILAAAGFAQSQPSAQSPSQESQPSTQSQPQESQPSAQPQESQPPAQAPSQESQPSAQPQPQEPQPSAQSLPQDWLPRAIQGLSQAASSHTDFTFDHSMLILASKTDQDDDAMRRIIAGVDGVSVHRFRFQNGASYDPEILNAVRREYHAAGYEHVAGGGHNKQGGPGETDLFFHLENNAIRKMAFLVVGRDHINFVTVSGSISPLDLLHLAGHFGIPPIEGGIKIPNSVASQAPAQQPAY